MIDNFSLETIVGILADYSWSPLTILLFIGSGLYVTFYFRFIQITKIKDAFYSLISSSKKQQGELSSFQALATVLSGTIGTGNIAGVATAIFEGGPGALFWIWLTALIGMALKFVSCTMGHRYRQNDIDGEILGGPMTTIKHGLNMPKLAIMFAFFAIVAAITNGAIVQANSIVDGVAYIFPTFSHYKLMLGFIISFLVGIVILGGISRIANLASFIVPFMAISYFGAAAIIILFNISKIPQAFSLIFQNAFNIKAVTGATLGTIIQRGVARGLFISEAGLGSAPIALSTINHKISTDSGYVGMICPLIDTFIACTFTTLVIVLTIYLPHQHVNLNGAPLSAYAFSQGLGQISPSISKLGDLVVGFSLILFSYTTIIAWSYYADRALCYLVGHNRYALPFKYFFLFSIVLSAVFKVSIVWHFVDIATLLMALPNIISIVCLTPTAYKIYKEENPN